MSRRTGASSGERSGARIPCPGVADRWGRSWVNNGSDVPLLGRVCSERRGAPCNLAGPHCRLAAPRAEVEGEAG
jgi:hypothetical protein